MVKQVTFPGTQYYQLEYKKKQFVLHHSGGWDNAQNVFGYWAATPERVATAYAVVDDGTIFQGFDARYYAAHIYVRDPSNNLPAHLQKYKTREHNTMLEKQSIGVEICNWGRLWKIGNAFHTWVSKSVDPKFKTDVTVKPEKVVQYKDGFRGAEYYERYTNPEIVSVRELIMMAHNKFEIPLTKVIFDIDERAISGAPGITTHVNYHLGKSDCHPQPELVEMLDKLTLTKL